MPINAYTGLMGSGKTYEVVFEVILPAVLSGRNIVTNVDGISQEKIHEYLLKYNKDADPNKLGLIKHVTNEDVFKEDFLPYYDDKKEAHVNTIVSPGDLVAIDEAWRFWGSDSKILKQHKSFFLEHRHFTNPETNVSCDLVLMIQDISTLNRALKYVVAFTYRTHKKVSLGLTNTYSVQMWEGYKLNRSAEIGSWVKKYDKEIFPLYSSFKGGVQGKIVNADKRQNIFSNKGLLLKILVMIIVLPLALYNIYHHFKPDQAKSDASDHMASTPITTPTVSKLSEPPQSEWRIAGRIYQNGQLEILLVDSNNRLRIESASNFHHTGIETVGDVDGKKSYTYSLPVSKNFLEKK